MIRGLCQLDSVFIICVYIWVVGCSGVGTSGVEYFWDEPTSAIIIGKDDRTRVIGPRTSNDRAVGLLVGKENQGTRVSKCTATAIGESYAITSAHCLFTSGALKTDLFFYPGMRSDQTQPFGRFPVTDIFYPKAYEAYFHKPTSVEGMDYDIAIIKVGNNEREKSIGQVVGSRGWWGPHKLPTHRALTLGYPGDKESGVLYKENQCYIGYFRDLTLRTLCDVFGGQSGSPIFIHHEKTKDDYIIGVISGMTDEENLVTRITKERQQIMNSIVANKYSPSSADKAELWVRKKVPRGANYRILVDNRCPSKMLVAYRAIKDDGKWHTNGFFEVNPGKIVEVFQTPNAIYMLHAHNANNRRDTINGNRLLEVPDSAGKFFFKTPIAQRFGDNTHVITNCQE